MSLAASPQFSEVLCVGLGLSGVCLGAQLKRKYGLKSMHFYERNTGHSGTWWSNRYPGAACDVPAIFYSYSFELNPDWSRFCPSQDEIHAYIDSVVEKYGLRQHMTFQTECESAHWDNKRQIWTVHLRNVATGKKHAHECRVLFSAVGVLVDPKDPEILGRETFQGPMFHTARYQSDVELRGKDVIVIGNGCSASQMVPEITPISKTLTQFIHTPHWLLERENIRFGPGVRWAFRHIPGLARFVRIAIFLYAEQSWGLYILSKKGAAMRRASEQESIAYTERTAPKKYHEVLKPEWELGCKRRVFDADGAYLKSLHHPNLHLTKDPVIEILPHAVRTPTKTYPADVIIFGTGFQTNNGLGVMRVQGRNGEWLEEHWDKMGGPAAYNSTAVNGFPNFLMIYGPNSTTGHTSVIMAIENMVNYGLKIIDPVLKGHASSVEVKQPAEREYSRRLQAACKGRVWQTCSNWYVKNDWNSTLYPWSQYHFWWRSTFPTWSDWNINYTTSRVRRLGLGRAVLLLLFALSAAGAVATLNGADHRDWWSRAVEYAKGTVEYARSYVGA